MLPEGFHKKDIDVSPLKPGGSNFKTHVLVSKSSSQLRYRPSIGGALFVFVFFSIGLGFVIYNLAFDSGLMDNPSFFNFFGLSFGLIFTFTGIYMTFYLFKPRVFDKQIGYYYKKYSFKPNSKNLKNQLRLSTIVALQIIGETIRDEDGSYGSFELNLVLEDGTRRNVVDHGNLKSIIDDAHVLSEFLDIPIWHAETHKS
jgi:hypothetical protein